MVTASGVSNVLTLVQLAYKMFDRHASYVLSSVYRCSGRIQCLGAMDEPGCDDGVVVRAGIMSEAEDDHWYRRRRWRAVG